jgi:hypothetical protein
MKKVAGLPDVVGGGFGRGRVKRPPPVPKPPLCDDNAVTREAAVIHTTFKLERRGDQCPERWAGRCGCGGKSWNNFAFASANDDTFVLTRVRLHSDLRLCPRLSASMWRASARWPRSAICPAGGVPWMKTPRTC